MTKTILLATTAALAFAAAAAPAFAETAPTAPRQTAEASDQGVLVFAPDFFRDARPNTALDMVNRVPGFSVNDGDGARGFEGAVGNILINGTRPASKNDTGSNVLGRTVATQVERIELVRGGAPGIDMQGQPVVLNIIRRGGSYSTMSSTVFVKVYPEGNPGGHARIEAARRSDTFSIEGTLSFRDELMQMDSGDGPVSIARIRTSGTCSPIRES